MTTSRQQVFEYIREQKTATVADLSRALGMTPANARHHLKILQDLELVEASTHKKQAGKGRPARVFRLSEKIEGNNSELLASVLLRDLLDQTSFEDLPILFQRLAKIIAENDDNSTGKYQTSLASRLFLTIQRLNQLHYQARSEARSNAPRLVFSNCPYLKILDRFPVICALDAALIQELVGLPADQKAKLIQDAQGGRICVFQINIMRTFTQSSR